MAAFNSVPMLLLSTTTDAHCTWLYPFGTDGQIDHRGPKLIQEAWGLEALTTFFSVSYDLLPICIVADAFTRAMLASLLIVIAWPLLNNM